ncbi:glycoside hydrolase family 3 protein [Vallitalea pronyensis]|nr:glycoside hydrolase family 3 N-terminal domain-containing protein [Vallitalea pronyensis]
MKKVGQLMVCGFEGKTPSDEIITLIKDYHIGGIILFSRNIGTAKEVLALTNALQRIARDAGHEQPLFICVDQENGVVRRLGEGTTYFPGSMLIGATGNKANAYAIGLATGRELKALGINWNLAPVVDINNNPSNPVIGVRSFGEGADMVASYAVENIKGMHEAGIITTLKHFPGHGDTDSDSHLKLPVIPHTMERLEAMELKPFRACMEAGADTVMSAHVYFPTLVKSEKPATLAPEVMTGLLREGLGFQGVVTTDCMEMKAIADTYGTVGGAVKALEAGVDIVMISHTYTLQEEAIKTIVQDVEKGHLALEKIEASYNRILKLKEKYLDWDTIVDQPTLAPIVGCEEHQQLAEKVFREGITICKNDGVLPLSAEADSVLFIDSSNCHITGVEDTVFATHSLRSAIEGITTQVEVMEINPDPSEEEITKVLQVMKKFDKVIFGTFNIGPQSNLIKLVQRMADLGQQIVVIAMRNPYHLAYMEESNAFIATYEWTKAGLELAVKAVFGMEHVSGKLPVMKKN